MRHCHQDRVSLEIARHIASGLRTHEQWISQARANLVRWRQINHDAPSLLRCYTEWEKLLQQPLSSLCAALIAESDEGQRLRQNSPFAGVLSAQTVWEIKRRHRNETIAA